MRGTSDHVLHAHDGDIEVYSPGDTAELFAEHFPLLLSEYENAVFPARVMQAENGKRIAENIGARLGCPHCTEAQSS